MVRLYEAVLLGALTAAIIVGGVLVAFDADAQVVGRDYLVKSDFPPLIRECFSDTLTTSNGDSIAGRWYDSVTPTSITTIYRWRVDVIGHTFAVAQPPGVKVTLSETSGHGLPGAWYTYLVAADTTKVAGTDTMPNPTTYWANPRLVNAPNVNWIDPIGWSEVQWDTLYLRAIGADSSHVRWRVTIEGR